MDDIAAKAATIAQMLRRKGGFIDVEGRSCLAKAEAYKLCAGFRPERERGKKETDKAVGYGIFLCFSAFAILFRHARSRYMQYGRKLIFL